MDESVVLISSNVGSIFEENRKLYYNWKNALKEVIKMKNIKFMATENALIFILALQEFGGKSILSWEDANFFLGNLYKEFMSEYPIFVACVDCDINSQENYTVLTLCYCKIGALYNIFRSRNICSKYIVEHCYESFRFGYHVHRLENKNTISIKNKFPLEMFPNSKWSRKGYMINRLRFTGVHYLDIINLHLIHDSNFLQSINSSFYSSYTIEVDSEISKELRLRGCADPEA
ncbi:hypothetical protein MXB_3542 [Myxobolus squamalis]|nr:hypothetical protein MXB_3542 [Myxobolus squamalis]